MCIIAIKKQGVKMPCEEVLETMFKNNPDGAGFMYTADDRVVIHKGFMNYQSFRTALKKLEVSYNLTELPLIMHFRIATSGQVDAGTCHPFPIASKRKILRKSYMETDIGVVHNGIIPIDAPENMSDTMQYIAKKLSLYQKIHNNFYIHKTWQKRIEKEIHSKMAFLNSKGDIYTIGDFIKEPDGMIYSNYSFEARSFIYNYRDFLFDYPEYKKLSPIDGYIILDSGSLVDCEDDLYLIDKYGRVYEYDFSMDIATEIDAQAYTHEGMPYYYDETSAMYFYVSEATL